MIRVFTKKMLMFFLLAAFLSSGAVASTTETLKITASDAAAGDRYGISVSISGDRAIVGAPGAESTYIYGWDGIQWAENKLTASDGAAGNYFGSAVSISGDRAIVGAPTDDDGGFLSGSAYIYEWDGIEWVESKLTASDAAVGDQFGSSVSISGNRAVVGAEGDDDGGTSSGSAYIYEWDGIEWVETKLIASDAAAFDFFGTSVSISEFRAIVGSYYDDDAGSESGSAYIYDWDGTNWVETKLTASDAAGGEIFGGSVSISGDRAVVGAQWDDDGAGISSGSAYIYVWDGSQWVETKLTASDARIYASYGSAVSISGGRVIVGASRDSGEGTQSGSAYTYDWDGSQWVETKLVQSDAASQDYFGLSVSVGGDRAIIGAVEDDDGGSNSGSAYLFEFDPVAICNGLLVTVDFSLGQTPTLGDDVVRGTSGADVIAALAGNDTICGEGGDDVINAGPGDDWVDAGDGDDKVFGLDGADRLYGGKGHDEIVAGEGADYVYGQDGHDILNGGSDNDTVWGGAGDDEIFGQGGGDRLHGEAGDDFIIGVGGVDTITGGAGDDTLNGGPGNDTVKGGDGADTVFGLTGDDDLDGGLGNDFVFGQLGDDTISGGGGDDQLFGNGGNDTITAESGANIINGGAGDDMITGGSGNDNIFGDGNLQQAGNDVIDGGQGSDLILGFSGSDTITSSNDGAVDTVNGGPDADVCITDAMDNVFNCP